MTMLIIVIIFIVIILLGGISESNKKAKAKAETELAKSKVDIAFNAGEITETQRDILLQKIDQDKQFRLGVDGKIAAFKRLLQQQAALIHKYGDEIGGRLVNHQYWIGMTEEQLLDCKGNPDKIEREVLKTKTKVIYIYGNKSSGDYFILVNGKVEKFVDR